MFADGFVFHWSLHVLRLRSGITMAPLRVCCRRVRLQHGSLYQMLLYRSVFTGPEGFAALSKPWDPPPSSWTGSCVIFVPSITPFGDSGSMVPDPGSRSSSSHRCPTALLWLNRGWRILSREYLSIRAAMRAAFSSRGNSWDSWTSSLASR